MLRSCCIFAVIVTHTSRAAFRFCTAMKKITSILASLLISVTAYGQALVPSQLIVAPKFQKYYDSARTVNLPPGFSMSVFYTGSLVGPRFMAFRDDGTLCVADDATSAIF